MDRHYIENLLDHVKHNRVYRLKLIKAMIAIVVFIVAVGIVQQIYLSNRYQDAVTNALNGEYPVSMELLEPLGNYKDSAALTDYMLIKTDFNEDVRESYASTLDALTTIEQQDSSSVSNDGIFVHTPEMSADFSRFKGHVEALEQEYQKDQTAASIIATAIDTLPDGSEPEHEDSIKQARAQYENAPEPVQILIKNHEKIAAAELQLTSTIEYHKECKTEAAAFDQQLKEIETVSLDSKGELEALRTAYQSLSKETQEYLQHYSLLENAEKEYAALKAAKEEEERIAKEEKERLEKKEQERLALEKEAEEKRALEQAQEDSDSYASTVYWTPNGEKYHLSKNCRTLKRSKTIYSGSISESGKSDDCNVCS